MMKKVLIFSMGALLLMSSCGTYEASGATTGAYFGSIIGSAIGGITGGWRGSDVGSLVGMAGGAVVGAAIGKAADEKAEQRYADYAERRDNARRNRREWDNYDSGFDATNSGDDRIMMDGMSAPTPDMRTPMSAPKTVPLEIRRLQVMERDRNGILSRGEEGRVVFEIYNPTSERAFNVEPIVSEMTGNKHIHISDNVMIESIGPKQAMRYTAMLKADSRLKDGDALIRVSLLQGGREVPSQIKDYHLRTSRR